MKNMEIFGNDLYKGNMEAFLATFTSEHFPNLLSIDMSCMILMFPSLLANGLKTIHITADMFPALDKLSLDSNETDFCKWIANDLSSVIIDDNALHNLNSLKLGCITAIRM